MSAIAGRGNAEVARGRTVARLLPAPADDRAERFAQLSAQVREERARYGLSTNELLALRRTYRWIA